VFFEEVRAQHARIGCAATHSGDTGPSFAQPKVQAGATARALRRHRLFNEQSAVLTTNIRDRFLADHESLEAHLDRVVAALTANDGTEASRLWTEFKTSLLAHLEAEEAHLIPQLLGRIARDAWSLIQEHRHIRARLAELAGELGSQRARLDSVRNFKDELRAHALSEDRLLYSWAGAHLDEPSQSLSIDALASKQRRDKE
jgi:hypothetical protein